MLYSYEILTSEITKLIAVRVSVHGELSLTECSIRWPLLFLALLNSNGCKATVFFPPFNYKAKVGGEHISGKGVFNSISNILLSRKNKFSGVTACKG